MKKIILLSLFVISGIALNAYTNGNAEPTNTSEKITFYEVPLVCGADAEIGCGSRAKPALMDLEKNSEVKEAWLNRQGTVFAIVWNESEETKKVAKPIFNKHEIDYSVLKGEEAKKNLATFRQENLWYKGTDVDNLSIEEAEHIATTLVNFALERNLITQEEADKLKPGVENYFKTELVKVRTPEQLCADSEKKFSDDLIAISESVLGKERTKAVLTQYNEYKMKECKKNASGCTRKDGCCKKNN